MTKEEIRKYLMNMHEAINALEKELCDDISEDGTLTVNVEDGTKVKRVLVCGDNHFGGLYYPDQELNGGCNEYETNIHLPPVTPAEKVGKWQKISDYRYRCSRCGNVVLFSSEENLYRFSRRCGQCGSNNDRGKRRD